MLRQLRDPACEAHEEFKAKTKMGARLGTDHLVGALNEHVSGRRGVRSVALVAGQRRRL